MPTVTVTATQGSIYANRISATGSVLPSDAAVVKSQLYTGQIEPQALFTEALGKANSNFNDTSRGDRIELIEIGNSRARSTQSAKVLISPNDAYVQAGPYWISVFSAQMLLQIPETHSGRLAPGFCPFRPVINTAELNQIQTLMATYFTNFTSYFGYIQPSNEQWPQDSYPTTSESGYLESKNSEDPILRAQTND